MVSPEMVCCFESMLASHQHLQDLGITLISPGPVTAYVANLTTSPGTGLPS